MNRLHRLLLLTFSAVGLSLYGADAAANWKQSCAKCHGPDGKGDTKMGHKLGILDLSDPDTQAKFSEDDIFKAVKLGRTDANGKVTMKAIEGMTDDEVKALEPFVRALKK
jgi:cytochrome c553